VPQPWRSLLPLRVIRATPSAPAYNAAGQRTAVTTADGSRWDYSYDALGQVTAGHRRQAGGAAYLGQQI